MSRIEPAFRIALGALFLAAGLLKIADPSAFAFSIARLQVIPRGALGTAAIVLPWMEAVAGAALLFAPAYRPAAVRVILGLLVALTVVLAVAIARGTAGPCGCFGGGDGFLSRPGVALGRNVLLLGMAAVLTFRPRSAPASPA